MRWEDISLRLDTSKGDEAVFDELKKDNKPILIYGCSNYSEIIYGYLKEHGIQITAFVVDKQYWRKGKYIKNLRVDCIDNYSIENYNIIVGFGDVNKSRFLMSNRSLLRSKFYFLWNPVEYYHWDIEYVKNNWKLFDEVYNGLADEKSRVTLFELIIAKLNGYCDEHLLKIADSGLHYFNELTFCADSEDEVFVDCGAYVGDTILQYAAFTNKKYRKIYAFEPGKEFVKDLVENTGLLENVEIIHKGVWREKSILTFQNDKEISYISECNGKDTVEVTTIDDAISKEEVVSFIKMDIEGSEFEALQGAIKTIQKKMPKLAICCYHKKDDFIRLFHFIHNIQNEEKRYKIYLRHHSNSACETIFYAIPCKKS